MSSCIICGSRHHLIDKCTIQAYVEPPKKRKPVHPIIWCCGACDREFDTKENALDCKCSLARLRRELMKG